MRNGGLCGLAAAVAVLFGLLASTARAEVVVVKLSPKTVRVGGTVTLTVRASKKTLCFLVYQYTYGWAKRVRPTPTAEDGTITWKLKMGKHNGRTSRLVAIIECGGDPQLRVHYTLLKG